MSNIVREMMIDVAHKLEDPEMVKYTPPMIIRQMKRLYTYLNRRYQLVQDSTLFETDDYSLDAVLGYYVAEPDPVLEIYEIHNETNDLYPDFQNLIQYKKTISNIFTLDRGSIYFSNLQGTEDIRINYYSIGKILVDKSDVDLAATVETEANTPEWKADFQQYLMLGTAMRLSTKYPSFKIDAIDYNDGLLEFVKFRHHKTGVTPTIIGGGVKVRSKKLAYGDG